MRGSEQSAHLSVVPVRTSQTGLRSLRSWLGKQAAIGGRPYVERIVKSDEFARRFLETLSGESSVTAILAKAPLRPVLYKPSRLDSRVKIRWTDEANVLFRRLAPRIDDNKKLAVAMGFSSLCAGAISRKRFTEFGPVSATKRASPLRAPPALAMSLAA